MKTRTCACQRVSPYLLALITSGLLLMFASSLFGQQAPVPVSSPRVENPEAVLNYWTEEKMSSAIPMEQPEATGQEPADNFITAPGYEPAVIAPSAPPSPDQNDGSDQSAELGLTAAEGLALPLGYSYPFPFTRYNVVPLLYAPQLTIQNGPIPVPATFPYKTAGKLYFTNDSGQARVCSASVIFDHLLLTARHCIYNAGTGNFYSNVMFAPGRYFRDNPQLGGRWVGRMLWTWARPAPNWRYDIGFIQLFDNDGRGCGGSQGGRPIETYTGHLGSFWGGSYDSVHWNQFGYPAVGMFNGQVMVEADSSTGQVGGAGSWNGTVQVGNDMTGGSSGGPWIRHMFPDAFGALQNLANGVNSFEPSGRPFATGSPAFFQYNYGDLYAGAKALPCP